MSTHSSITVKIGNQFKTIYCHWDGYLEHTGKFLHTYYRSQKKAEALVALGNLSFLDKSIEKPKGHSFNNYIDGYTVTYHRDRGEEWGIVQPSLYTNFFFALQQYGTEYNYLWDGKKWLVNGIPIRLALKRYKFPKYAWKDETIDWEDGKDSLESNGEI